MSQAASYDIFLSHNSADKPAVEVIGRRLRAEGLRPFLDKWELVPGKPWQPKLADALAQSECTAIFVGPSGAGVWHNQETQLALNKAALTRDDYRVIPVLLPGADVAQVDGFLALRTWVDFRAGLDDETAFRRLVSAIKGEAPRDGEPDFRLPDEPAPYVGLRAYDAGESRFFFGRDAETERLLQKLRVSQFLAIVGASGSGKSSLVRAGLLPRLQADAIAGSARWKPITVVPGARPLEALASQVARLGPEEGAAARRERIDDLQASFAAGKNGLHACLSELASGDTVLLIVDQFEEVFTHARPEDDGPSASGRFIENLAHVATAGDRRFRVLLTVRADFLPQCLGDAALRALLEDHQLLLGPLDDAALREAVERPARDVGAFFEKGLVRLILEEVGDPQGTLPLLQDALYALWVNRSGPWLTHRAYEHLGGVRGALRTRADATYEALNPRQKNLTREIFLRLTNVNEGLPPTRRRAAREQLELTDVPAADIDQLLEVFSGESSRLLVGDGDSYVVAHDAIYAEWPTLRDWLAKDKEGAYTRSELAQGATQWHRNKRAPDYLWRGRRLQRANRIVKETSLHLAQNERDFLRASQARSRREFLQRVVLPSLLATLLFTAATLWLLQPRQDRIQLYDAATREQVLRPFSITFGGKELNSIDAQVAAFVAAENRADPAQYTVQCNGFEGRVQEAEYLGDQRLVRLFVARDQEHFLREIVPNTNEISGVPKDRDIRAQLSQNITDQREVTLLVHNRCSRWVDVIMVFRPPTDDPSWAEPFLARETYIHGNPLPPGKVAEYKSFRLTPGFFLFLVSSQAQTAQLVASAALYRDKFCLLELEGDPITARITFSHERPSR